MRDTGAARVQGAGAGGAGCGRRGARVRQLVTWEPKALG